ncbi:MAG: NAD(P)-binding domain-containing protein [Rhodothermales bacterium]|nr:NAD(P)-binding domain-containing protein [Rhodothermales bacterium]MBO6781124.1 NAD(P)-binding domain-containing protein [Rhodothermales bacterium]
MTTIGVLGSGVVGTVLSNGFLKHGFAVCRGSRSPDKLEAWQDAAGPHGAIGTFAEAAAAGDIVALAVKGSAAKQALGVVAPDDLAGKVVIDTCNPISAAPPENGVLRYDTSLDRSLMEDLQEAYPDARFVKAFSCVGSAYMVDPVLPGGPPTMFICGNDADARSTVAAILEAFGWDVADMGTAEAARAIEPLAMLWCIPGFLHSSWSHAFKLLRA